MKAFTMPFANSFALPMTGTDGPTAFQAALDDITSCKFITHSNFGFSRLLLLRALHSIIESHNEQLMVDHTDDPQPSDEGRDPYHFRTWARDFGSAHGILDIATDLLRSMTAEASIWSSPVDMPRIVLIDCHMVLLAACCPLATVRTFAGWHASHSEIERARNQLKKWIEKEATRARQAVLHSAIIYCKVREKPSQVFYESSTFLLAILTLWAYGRLFSPPSGAGKGDSTENIVAGTTPFPTARLGHVFNSEQARQWINRGQHMRGYLEGVGNIWSDEGPRLILRQAIQTLNSMNPWGISQRYSKALDRLDCSRITVETSFGWL